ncbi:MAG: hypothetical protein IPG50_12310 [Myxococcales bacterium]|nr:hypothetical protein [Myxococcales bacterium]
MKRATPPLPAELPAFSPDGRWGGRLTQKPLPEADESLERLTAAERRRLAEIWLLRSGMERRVGDSFAIIHAALTRRRATGGGAAAPLCALAHRAVDDELRHTELSRLVASHFAGRALAPAPRLVLEPPRHKGASPALRDTLYVVGQCVLNETTAGVFLESCLEVAEGELARAALRELLSDEIEHGRLGWAYLASLPVDERRAVSPWLLPMAFLNLRQWRYETPVDERHTDGLARHGAPPAELLHGALVDALRTLIVPGLKELEIETAPVEEWLDAGADTTRSPGSRDT